MGVTRLPIIAKQVIAVALSDFPEPVADVITLEDNVNYVIGALIDIGVNRIQCGVKNSITSTDRLNFRLTSQTTGAMITADAASISIVLDGVGLSCPNGDLLSIDGCGVAIIECTIVTTENGGTINDPLSFTYRNTGTLSAFTTNGFVFTGSGGRLVIQDNVVTNNAGTVFDMGTAVFNNIVVSRNIITENASQTFINGAAAGANVSLLGLIAENTFMGAGTFANVLTNSDAKWSWYANVGISNTAVSASLALTEVEKDLGSVPSTAGSFDIASTGLSANKQVLIQQKAAAYTGKGDLKDECEMDMLAVTGYVVDATTIRCYWNSQRPVVGNFKFGYLVSA